MNISENIRWITGTNEGWALYTNRSYRARIQKADPDRIYNVPDTPGVVYNILDDSYEKVGSTGYVVTGAAGEMWPIGEGALRKYKVSPEEITSDPMPVDTVELDTVFAGIRIPVETTFTLEVDYGEKALLKGNRPDIAHGDGDYVLVAAKLCDGRYVPDFTDSGRVVNGAIFDILYKPFCG
ncbi:MAG: hypothetical protein IJ236_07930 [Oscillospiraceae bacterium]|nr:hypothetical protein [Oscillospiraceae bacterium]